MKNKALTFILIIVVTLTLVGIIGLILAIQLKGDAVDKEPTIDEILEAIRGRTRNHDEFIRP